jgi:vitamin B12 transporter
MKTGTLSASIAERIDGWFMKARLLFGWLCIIWINPAQAQQTSPTQVAGIVRDGVTRQPLIGVALQQAKGVGTLTDSQGRFALPVSSDTIRISYLGYAPQIFVTDGQPTSDITISLLPQGLNLQEVIVKADQLSTLDVPGHIVLKRSLLERTQGLLEDPLNSLLTMPGISRVGDLFASSQLHVRGGAPDETLFLLNNVPMAWPWYFGGQKSMFNTELIDQIELLTGGFSAAYGNHMSSVLNVTMRDGSFSRTRGSVSVGVYNAQATLETPIVADKLSLLVGGRMTYMDKLAGNNPAFPYPTMNDISFNLSYRLNAKHQLNLSGTFSKESVDFASKEANAGVPTSLYSLGYKNTQSLIWQSRWTSRLYNKLSLTNNTNNDEFALEDYSAQQLNSRSSGFRNDLTYFLGQQAQLKVGMEAYRSTFGQEGFQYLGIEFTDPQLQNTRRQVFMVSNTQSRTGAYAQYEGRLIGKLQTNVGFRWDQTGGRAVWSPRLRLTYPLSTALAVHAAYGLYHQFASLAMANQQQLDPNLAIHYLLGLKQTMGKGWSAWIEAYYKDYEQLTITRPDNTFANGGYGRARGIEGFVQKQQGPLQGTLSYALSQSQRTLGYDAKLLDAAFDQRHMLNATLDWFVERGEQFWLPSMLQLRFRYETGRPYTPIERAVATPAGWYPIRGEIHSMRDPDYQNLNLRIEWRTPLGAAGNRAITSYFDIWNVLNQQNVVGRQVRYGREFRNNVDVRSYYAYPFLFGGGFRLNF